jgi:hypothetical protein
MSDALRSGRSHLAQPRAFRSLGQAGLMKGHAMFSTVDHLYAPQIKPRLVGRFRIGLLVLGSLLVILGTAALIASTLTTLISVLICWLSPRHRRSR